MHDIFHISNSVREKASDPMRVLLNIPCLDSPRVILRDSILSIVRVSKCVFLVHCPEAIYISTALNEKFEIEAGEYVKIVAKKCYSQIYYDIEVS